jgi:hypothetical protein
MCQALLAYWQDVMADDVYIIIQDGYNAARETENIKEGARAHYRMGRQTHSPQHYCRIFSG